MASLAKSRRWTAWIAALAILLSALAPSISHAVVAYAGGPADSVLVCTSTGYKWVNVTTGEQRNASGDRVIERASIEAVRQLVADSWAEE